MAYLFKKPEDSTKALETPQQFAGMGTTPTAPQTVTPSDVAAGAGREIMRGNVGRGVEGVKETLLKPVREQTEAIKRGVSEQEQKYQGETANLASTFGQEYNPELLNKAISGENTAPEYRNIQSILGYTQKVPEDVFYTGSRKTSVAEPIRRGTIAENLQRTKRYGTGLANIDAALFGTGKNYGDVVRTAEQQSQDAARAIGGLESGELERQRQQKMADVIAQKKGLISKDIANKQAEIKGGLETKALQSTEANKQAAEAQNTQVSKRAQEIFDKYMADWQKAEAESRKRSDILSKEGATLSPLFSEAYGVVPELEKIKSGLGGYSTQSTAPVVNWKDLVSKPEYTQLSNLANLLGQPVDFGVGAGGLGASQASLDEARLEQELQNLINPNKEKLSKALEDTVKGLSRSGQTAAILRPETPIDIPIVPQTVEDRLTTPQNIAKIIDNVESQTPQASDKVLVPGGFSEQFGGKIPSGPVNIPVASKPASPQIPIPIFPSQIPVAVSQPQPSEPTQPIASPGGLLQDRTKPNAIDYIAQPINQGISKVANWVRGWF